MDKAGDKEPDAHGLTGRGLGITEGRGLAHLLVNTFIYQIIMPVIWKIIAIRRVPQGKSPVLRA